MADDTLYIDADEEITSVIDKLKGSEAQTVLLVVPKGASLLQSVVNLKLLKKEADEHSKNIAFVTSDNVGRNLAFQVGIPVYQDVEGKEPVAPPPRPERPPTEDVVEVDMSERGRDDAKVAVHHYQGPKKESGGAPSLPSTQLRKPVLKRNVLIGLAIFLAALAGLLFLFPKTTVVLGVKGEPLESNIDLTIDKNTTELAKNSSILPGTAILVEKEKSTTATATGKKTVGETAKGTVTVDNCYQSVPLSIASGTGLTSGGKNFVTTAAVTVPGATIVGPNCTAPGQASVAIAASAVGPEGNVSANSPFCVTGYSCSGGTYVSAKNSAALSGGSSKDVTFLKQEDIDAAVNLAKDELFGVAQGEIKKEAEEKKLRVLDAAVDSALLERKSDKEVGVETNDAQVTVKVRVRTLAFREADYRQVIVDLLSLRIPQGKRLILTAQDEISTSVSDANWEQGFMKVVGDVKTNVAPEIDENLVKRRVKAKSVGRAKTALQEVPGVVEATVQTTPRFLNWTALWGRNITVKQEAK